MSGREPPPQADQFELSIFGPGRGECVLLHLGVGEWICVDSCLDSDTGQPVALRYLHELGVDLATALKLIVVSHWHQDHMKGAATLLRAAPSAEFACSGALKSHEFFTAVAASEAEYNRRQGLAELAEIFGILTERRAVGVRLQSVAPMWVQEGSILLERPSCGERPTISVRALSPSGGARRLGMTEVAAFLPAAKQPKRRPVALGPNEQSVAIWVDIGRLKVLLGGDLENSPDAGIGWKAVLASPVLPPGRAEIFKVSHHGSRNADNEDLWAQKLTTNQPLAVLSPFASASKPIPSEADQKRIASRTSRAYCTSDPKGSRPVARDKVVQRKIRSIPLRMRVVVGRTGHVRVRVGLEDESPPSVELFSGAFQIQ